MSSHNEQLQPTPFDVAQPAPVEVPAAAAGRRREGTPAWVLPALGGLVVLAVLVIFWLPERINTGAPQGAPADPAAAAAASPAQPGQAAQPAAGPEVSPWSDAQAAKQRKEAQDVLAELLELQETLEGRGVKAWAADQLGAVAALATAGDELFRTRDYAGATARYREGLEKLKALEASIPVELARHLALANEALEKGDLAQANTALDKVDAIDPGNAEAAALRRRIEALPQLLALLEQAASAEKAGDLPAAIALLKQAVALDASHQRSGDELKRVSAAHQARRFNEAMSAGYSALDARQFDTARKAFRQAASLQPGSAEAKSALQEVEAAATAQRLAGLQGSGAKAEQAEQWEQAVSAYEQAQKIDPNVLFAREGLERSRDRARLDKQLRATIDDPLRLGDVAVATAAEKMLQFARNVSPRGALLERQIGQLERLLQQANTPVKVALRSDAQTDVVVYKVAKLGKFNQHELALRPGAYTAVGSRMGYRDVRVDFTVKPEGPPPALTIACTEAI